MDRILLITVNFHTAAQTVDFCRGLRAIASPTLLQIRIADNSGCFFNETNADLALAASELAVEIVDPGGNLGYFGGADYVLKDYLACSPLPDCVIVANSDIEILSDDFFRVLVSLDTIGPDVFGIAPDIVRAPRGTDVTAGTFRENPMATSRGSALAMRIRVMIKRIRVLALLQHILAHRRRRASIPLRPDDRARRSIYMMHGSFMILLRAYFERTAGLAFPSFLFGEEIFVAEETLRGGGKLVFEPTLRLNHYGGATTMGMGSRDRDRLEADSLEQLARRYF